MNEQRRVEPLGTLDELIEKLYAELERVTANADAVYQREIVEYRRIRLALNEADVECLKAATAIRDSESAVLATGFDLARESVIDETDVSRAGRRHKAEITAGIRDDRGGLR